VILAIGQTPDLSLVPKEIRESREDTIAVEPVTLATTLSGVFACGDAVSGPTSVVEAIASSKTAAISVDRYLKGEDLKAGRKARIKKVEKPPKEGVEKEARCQTPLLSVEQRSRYFNEVKMGFSEEMAMSEAQRCMTCGSKAYIAYLESCMTCYNCELECPYEAVNVDPFRKIMPPLIIHPGDNTKYDVLYTSKAAAATSRSK